MITLIFETAHITEAPPAECGEERRRCFLGPGTRATVHLILHGPEGPSKRIGVSGTTGEIFYDEQPTGYRTCGDFNAGAIYHVAEPFAMGRRAGVRLAPTSPLTLTRVDKVVVGHDRQGAGAEWFLKSVLVQLDSDRSYEFACNRWLQGDDLELVAPITSPTLPPTVTPVAPLNRDGTYGSSKFNQASYV